MRKKFLIAAILIAGLAAVYFSSRPRDEKPADPGATPSTAAASGKTAPAPPPPASAKPGETVYPSGMKPGEVQPGPKPGTLLVQPLGPEPPKIIKDHYRARPPGEDPRIDRTADGRLVFNDALDMANRLHGQDITPTDDVEILATIIGYYRMIYKQNPVAEDNAHVINALAGNNPQKVVVFPDDHPDLNANRELTDRWGTPYFFHSLSRDNMDIWSAGPDTRFGTRDDVKLGAEQPALQLGGDPDQGA